MTLASRSYIGLDVGERLIAAARVTRDGDSWRLEQAACWPRSRHTVEQSAAPWYAVGEVEADAIIGVLDRQGFLSRTRRIAGRTSLVMSVPHEVMLSASIELPPASSGAPIDQIARDELARSSRIESTRLECDWWRLPLPPAPGQRAHTSHADTGPSMIVGCTHDAADAISASLDAARGPGVSALDARGCALARVAQSAAGATTITGVLDISWRCASLSIGVGDSLVYERVLDDAAWRTLHARLCSELSIEPDVTDHILQTIGVRQEIDSAPDAESPDLLCRARLIITDYLNALAGEVRVAMEYTTRRYCPHGCSDAEADTMQRVLVIGEGARTPELATHLGDNLSIRTQTLRPSGVCTTPPGGLAGTDDPAITCAVGLSMWRPQASLQQREETAA
jgi:Tfp pilus assembly PilM family ATPase